MRLFKQICTIAMLSISGLAFCQDAVSSAEIVTLSDYVENNPNCLTQEIIYDGCTMMLNSDGEYLFGQLNILHPELQMRILMQGITFYVDPTGKKREKYALHFPAASAVESVMAQLAPPEPSEDMSKEVLPDISPLVSSISSLGTEYEINGRKQRLEFDNSAITLNDSTHCLSYTFLIPVDKMLTEKKLNENWKLGIYSEGGRPSHSGPGMGGPSRGPGMDGPGMGRRPEMNSNVRSRKERNNNSQSSSNIDLRKMMVNDIEVWIPFSFSQICTMELSNENAE